MITIHDVSLELRDVQVAIKTTRIRGTWVNGDVGGGIV